MLCFHVSVDSDPMTWSLDYESSYFKFIRQHYS